MSSREGSWLLDPTKGLTPGGAKRARERFTNMIEDSKRRIRELEAKKQQTIEHFDERIQREEVYIQEASLVLRMIEDQWGEDCTGYDPDPDSKEAHDIEVLTKAADQYEITLYGTPWVDQEHLPVV